MSRAKAPAAAVQASGPGWLQQLLVIPLLIGCTLALRLPYLNVPLERDEGEYAYIAWRMDSGELPYRDVFDQKAPGTFAIYWLTFRVLGESTRDIHLAGAAFVALEVILLYVVALHFVRRSVAIGAAILCAWLTAGITLAGFASNTEIFATPFAVLAVLLSVLGRRRGSCWLFALAGLSVGLGALVKQSIFFFALVPLLLACASPDEQNRKRFSILRPLAAVAGVALVWVAVFLFFAARSALGQTFYWVFLHNLQYAAREGLESLLEPVKVRFGQLWFSYWVLWLLAAGGLLAWVRRRGPQLLLAVSWTLASLLAVGVGHMYRHYFQMALPAVLVLGAVGFQRAWDFFGRARNWVAAARVALVLLTVGFPLWDDLPDAVLAIRRTEAISPQIYTTQIFNMSPAIAAWVSQLAKPGECIYIFGTEPQIAFYAKRRLCTSHILTDPIFGPYTRAAEFQEQVKQDILRDRPAVVVYVRDVRSTLMRSPLGPLPMFLEPYLRENYVEVAGFFTQDPDRPGIPPRMPLGRPQVSQRVLAFNREIQDMQRKGLPDRQIEAFAYRETPMVLIEVRRDLTDRLPAGW